MASRFEKFSARARRVLSLAQDASRRFGHNHLRPEHILHGLTETEADEGIALMALKNLGVEPQKVRSAIEFILSQSEASATDEFGFTKDARRIVELAVDEARRLEHQYIGSEHLLIAFLREGEGIAAGVLGSLGVKLDPVRSEVLRLHREIGTAALEGTQLNAVETTSASLTLLLLPLHELEDDDLARIIGILRERTAELARTLQRRQT